MEDLLTDTWISISESNPDFEFTASPDDGKERFVLHFMGPTAIFDVHPQIETKVFHIYTTNHTVMVHNETEEMIKEVAVYNLLGQEIERLSVTGQSSLQFKIHENRGYYVVRVHTEQSIYTEKVFIN